MENVDAAVLHCTGCDDKNYTIVSNSLIRMYQTLQNPHITVYTHNREIV